MRFAVTSRAGESIDNEGMRHAHQSYHDHPKAGPAEGMTGEDRIKERPLREQTRGALSKIIASSIAEAGTDGFGGEYEL